MADTKRTREEVTYGLFDIDPARFYSERFVSPIIVSPDLSLASLTDIVYQKIQRLLGTIRSVANGRPLKILEVGCASGLTGARVKFAFPNCRLHGVDLSKECIEVCRKNQFDEVVAHDVFKGLPYEDESFDFVFSMDFWGHIEFARKDPIVAECFRVTKKGGHGWHGIEAGFIDYCNCNPKDPEDHIRKYVWTEGHVGVETLEENYARFAKWFNIHFAVPWPIKPFLNISNILANKVYGDAFNNAFLPFDGYNSRICADVIMGYCGEYVLDRLVEAYGPILTKDVFAQLSPKMADFAEKFVQGSGFAILSMQRPA